MIKLIRNKNPSPVLYHVTAWKDVVNLNIGDKFILIPGPQQVEGKGVYFSEDFPRFTAAEGSKNKPTAIIAIIPEYDKQWWKTKSSIARKYSRPITWHSNGANVECLITDILDYESIPILYCNAKRIK